MFFAFQTCLCHINTLIPTADKIRLFMWRNSGLLRLFDGCAADASGGVSMSTSRVSVEGGVASFCCSKGIWHGAERGRGRERHSPLGINSSSEVWTENATMGSHDWKHNGKSQAPRLFWFHSSFARTATGRFGGEHNGLHHCRQVHLASCEDVPRCVQLQLPYEDPVIRSEANTARGHKFHRIFETRRLGVNHVVSKDMGWNLQAMWVIYRRNVLVIWICDSWLHVFWCCKQMAR